MKHIIIGTAGHIDHGKTALVKALTGRDTDTLEEEKERGISINLGFTFFDLPSGKRAGIIDVPGHEKFIKNMLAGASGIDIVLLVIAADEGIMPQTREHFQILELLNVKKGIVVLTKIDLVDKDWLDMVKEDVTNEMKGTFLENAPLHAVSSKTGEGLDGLISDIDRLTDETEAKDTEGHFRLPVDRVFSISGFGTVVTGTIISGRINEGDMVEVYPSLAVTKIRGIQVHEKPVKYAEAGQRCALNLSGIKTDEIKRGDVISLRDIMEPSLIADCRLHYLKSAAKPLQNRQRVRVYHGTSEIIARVVLLDKEELNPGEDGYAELRLENVLTSQRNDRFVIRSYSPMYTIGGGTIIEPAAVKAKRFDPQYIEALRTKEMGKTEDIIEDTVKKLSSCYPGIFEILKSLGKNEEDIEDKLCNLQDEAKIIKLIGLDKPIYVHADFIKNKTNDILNILKKFHDENPLKSGISREEIKNRVFGKDIRQKTYDEILQILKDKKVIDFSGSSISLYGFKIVYTNEQEKIKSELIKLYEDSAYMPPKTEDIFENKKDIKNYKMVYESLIDSSVLKKVSEDCIILTKFYESAKENIINFIKSNGGISIAQAKELLNTNRKCVVSILESFDNAKITKRTEDKRVLLR